MKVKNWLMDMQDYAFKLLEQCEEGHGLDAAKFAFLERYPNQGHVFDTCKQEWEEIDRLFEGAYE